MIKKNIEREGEIFQGLVAKAHYKEVIMSNTDTIAIFAAKQ